MVSTPQHILVFQQRGSGEAKLRGIREHGRDIEIALVIDVNADLPTVIDDADPYLPRELPAPAELVVDFLKHLDLRHFLAERCLDWGLPCVSSGRKIPVEGHLAPPT